MYGHIYKITNLLNHKVYIGQTKRDPDLRWKEYLRGGHVVALKEDFIKFGKQNFTFDVIDSATTYQELSEKEKAWVTKLESNNPKKGYNRYLGGYGVSDYKWDEVSRKSASEDRKGSAWMHKEDQQSLVRKENINNYQKDGWEFGMLPGRKRKSHSEATRLKMSRSAKGKPKTADQITKQQKSLKDKQYHWYTNGVENVHVSKNECVPEGYHLGRVYSEEICNKISVACKGRTPWNKGLRKVV